MKIVVVDQLISELTKKIKTDKSTICIKSKLFPLIHSLEKVSPEKVCTLRVVKKGFKKKFRCSECEAEIKPRYFFNNNFKYCPGCGAKVIWK